MKIEILSPVQGFSMYPYTVTYLADDAKHTAKYAAGCRTLEEAERIAGRLRGNIILTSEIKGEWDKEANYKRWYRFFVERA